MPFLASPLPGCRRPRTGLHSAHHARAFNCVDVLRPSHISSDTTQRSYKLRPITSRRNPKHPHAFSTFSTSSATLVFSPNAYATPQPSMLAKHRPSVAPLTRPLAPKRLEKGCFLRRARTR